MAAALFGFTTSGHQAKDQEDEEAGLSAASADVCWQRFTGTTQATKIEGRKE